MAKASICAAASSLQAAGPQMGGGGRQRSILTSPSRLQAATANLCAPSQCFPFGIGVPCPSPNMPAATGGHQETLTATHSLSKRFETGSAQQDLWAMLDWTLPLEGGSTQWPLHQGSMHCIRLTPTPARLPQQTQARRGALSSHAQSQPVHEPIRLLVSAPQQVQEPCSRVVTAPQIHCVSDSRSHHGHTGGPWPLEIALTLTMSFASESSPCPSPITPAATGATRSALSGCVNTELSILRRRSSLSGASGADTQLPTVISRASLVNKTCREASVPEAQLSR